MIAAVDSAGGPVRSSGTSGGDGGYGKAIRAIGQSRQEKATGIF